MPRFSKRSLEGEFIIDHRASPGLTREQVGGFDAPVVGEGEVFESPIITCSHCQATVVLNPDRSRSRGWCPKCDKYLCDECEYKRTIDFECRELARRLDSYQRAIELGQPNLALLLSRKGQ